MTLASKWKQRITQSCVSETEHNQYVFILQKKAVYHRLFQIFVHVVFVV